MYGKMLVLTFEDNQDAMMNRILSLINTKEEVIQMSGLNNHLLNFKGLMIDEVQRVIIRENQEIELTYTEFEILKLLAKHPGIGVHCRNQNEYGQSFRRCYPIKRKHCFSILRICFFLLCAIVTRED